MKEIIRFLINFKISSLLFEPTDNSLLQFFRYAFVGGIATIVDWGIQFFVTNLGVHYLITAVFAFCAGLICNFLLSKLFVFQAEKARLKLTGEFLSYLIIGVIGMMFTVIIMYLFTELLFFDFMISKMIATAIVLFWNFFARKWLVYQK